MKSKKTVKKVIQPLTFQEIIQKLNEFWSKAGCVVGQPYGLEVGAGTANPHTFFRALGPEPYNVAYVEPSRRPTDGRYGQNPNRLQHYYQYQVILKPAPENNIKLYIESLRAIGIDPEEHDLRFVEDNWQSAPLGAWGLGWEVWLDGMEVTQYTYFQQFAGIKLPLPCIEITYGLERLAMYIQDVTDYRQIKWNDTITYGDIFEKPEYWQSKYNFEDSNIEQLKSLYSIFEKSAQEQIDERKNYFSSYDNLLKLSHTFNLLDARGVISLNDRTSRFKKMGQLATKIGTAYLEERASMEYPFSKKQITLDSYEDKPQELAINHIKTDQPVYTLELGFEEIPAEYMAKWSNILTNNYLEDFLKETGLSYQKANLSFTSRRLVVQLDSPVHEFKKESIIKGPPLDMCYENDKPSMALSQFLKRYNGKTYKETSLTEKNRSYFAIKLTEVVTLQNVIQNFIEKLFADAPVAKWMNWDDQPSHNFIRPLRWIISYLDDKKIPVEYFGVKAENFTLSPRYVKQEKVRILSSQEYLGYIEQSGIILSAKLRSKIIEKTLYKNKDNYGYSENIQEYVELNTFLTESPVIQFLPLQERFKQLPPAVVRTILEDHQKYLVRWSKSDPTNIEFGIVSNGKKMKNQVIEGNKKVSYARLEDGVFYYQLDLQNGIPSRDALKRIVFNQNIRIKNIPKVISNDVTDQYKEDYCEFAGSYFGKAERISYLAKHILVTISGKNEVSSVFEHALSNLKNVKASLLVKEFPNLEEVMSGHYLEKSVNKLDQKVATIVSEHYLPNSKESNVPQSLEAFCISLADKIDTLVAITMTNSLPSSSSDPFEARKTVYNLLHLMINAPWHNQKNTKAFDLRPYLQFCFMLFGLSITETDQSISKLENFVKTRLYQYLRDDLISEDISRSVSEARTMNITYQVELVKELSLVEGEKLAKVFEVLKRVRNILTHEKVITVQTSDFSYKTKSEQDLSLYLSKIETSNISVAVILKLSQLLEDFFKENMVLDIDETIRQSRLSLVKRVKDYLDENLVYSN